MFYSLSILPLDLDHLAIVSFLPVLQADSLTKYHLLELIFGVDHSKCGAAWANFHRR